MSDQVWALKVLEGAGGSTLFAGGDFDLAGGAAAHNLARWDGSSLSGFAGVEATVRALVEHDDGSGPAIIAGGDFRAVGSVSANRIVRWDGASSSALGSGMDGTINALASCDLGGGRELFAGGEFLTAGGQAANRIARWDGASWSPLGTGLDGAVSALASFDDGSGPALYVAGGFTHAGGGVADGIARWDGAAWSALGSVTGIKTLIAYDDGTGPALVAGGSFSTAGGTPAIRIAKWDGTIWSPLGGGMSSFPFAFVSSLAVLDAGSGPVLYAGGFFFTAGGVPANHIARWDGTTWAPLLNGTGSAVLSLAVLDDGTGPVLCAGGDFTDANDRTHLARWDGTSWSGLGRGASDAPLALGVFPHFGPVLYAGGRFKFVLDSGDAYLARFGCPDTTAPTLFVPTSVQAYTMRTNPAGARVSFMVTASDDQDPAPDVVCVPPSGSFFPLGTTLVDWSATDASGNVSTGQFPVTVVERAKQRKP